MRCSRTREKIVSSKNNRSWLLFLGETGLSSINFRSRIFFQIETSKRLDLTFLPIPTTNIFYIAFYNMKHLIKDT